MLPIHRNDFLDYVEGFRRAHILVVGPAIAEIDVHCDVTRLAPDRVMPVYRCEHQSVHPGAAALSAATIRNLGAAVSLVSPVGISGAGQALARVLAEDRIEVISPAGRPDEACDSPELWRYLANGSRQLLQIRRSWRTLSFAALAKQAARLLQRVDLPPYDAVLVVDAQPASLDCSDLAALSELTRARGIPLVFDAAGGNCSPQKDMVDHLILNESEATVFGITMGVSTTSDIGSDAPRLAAAASANVLLTQGRRGATLARLVPGEHERPGSPGSIAPVPEVTVIPASPRELSDRRGVGFVLSGVYTLALAAGATTCDAAFLACGAASAAAAMAGPKRLDIDALHQLAFREIEAQVSDSIELFQRIGRELLPDIDRAARILLQAYTFDRQVLVFGNGGSAAEANHLVGELTGRFKASRPGLPAISLSANDSLTTCLANDYGYEEVFARQIQTFCREGDVVIGMSTSGKSPNVVRAMEAARSRGARIIAFTGSERGPMADMADVSINIPSRTTARIQEAHLFVIHVMCDMLDRRLDPSGRLHPSASEM